MELFSLFGSIFVKNDEANASIQKTEEKAGSLTEKLGAGIGTAAKWGAAIAGAATAAVGGLMAAAEKTAEYADTIDKLSERTGIGAEELQRWKYALEQSGGDVSKLEVGMKKLSGVVEGASGGNGKYTESLKKVGVSVEDLKHMTQEEIFAKVTSGLADMEEGTERNVLGNELLGKSYMDMVPLLNAGSEGIEGLKNRADELGLVMSGDMIQANVAFGDSLQDVKASFGAIFMDLTNQFLPVIQTVIDIILENMPMIQTLFSKLAPILTDMLAKITPILLEMAQKLLPIIFDLMEQLMPLFAIMVETILPPILDLITQLMPFIIDIVKQLLPPLIALVETLLPPIMKIIEAILPPLLSLLKLIIDPLVDLLNLILPPLTEIIGFLADVLAERLGGAFESIGNIVNAAMDIFGGFIDFITGIFTGNWEKAWEGVKKIFGGIWDGIKELFKIPVNWIIDGINMFLRALNHIEIPDWVPIVGGMGFHIPEIPRLKVGLDYVPRDYYPAYLDEGERVLTKEQNEEYSGGKGAKSVIYNLYFNNVREKDTAFEVYRAVKRGDRLEALT